ncbi:MAG: Rne/Rng family ribonuclease [Planctomycetota bacterium]|nr:Rne/Rng family ribonuclease [Planctomycetota bacterium]
MSDPATPGPDHTDAPGESAASTSRKRSEDPTSRSENTNTASPSSFGVGVGDSAAAEPAKPKRPRRSRAKKVVRDEAPASTEVTDSAERPTAPSPWDSSASDDGERRTTKKRRTRRKKKPSSEGSADGDEPREESSESGGEQSSDEGGERSTRKKRRSRRRKPSAESSGDEAPTDSNDEPSEGATEAGDSDEDKPSRRRRRGSRGGRRRKTKSDEGAEGSGEDEERPEREEREGDSETRRKPRRSRRRRGSKREDEGAPVAIEAIPGEEDDLPELEELPDEAELVDDSRGKRRGRTKKSSREPAAKEVAPEIVREDLILVNAVDKLESRVAVVHDHRIRDLSLEVNRVQSFVHNNYRGKVVNIEPAIGAAFVDFGQGKNGFLHVSDVLPEYGDKEWNLTKLLEAREGPNDDLDLSGVESDLDDDVDDDATEESEQGKGRGRGKKSVKKGRPRKERSRPRFDVKDLLKVGDKVVVQITKDAIGDKGPTLTTYISIPGRYLVLMPSLEMVGVSRKIEDEKERKRLRKIMQSFDVPGGMGLIVRTAGIGKTKAELQRDLTYLLALWDSFSKRLTHGKTPTPLYQENDLAIRTMRDLFSRRTKAVVVDDTEVCEEMRIFARKLMPEHEDRIVLHEEQRPIFHHYGVEQDYEKIFMRRVELPSGGSIVIDQTEALVAIDVNSGRTRSEGAVFEDIALKTNLEAVSEIALQIRLRDLGGILVLDFIDMMRKSSRLVVERTLRDAMHTDRARHKVGRISQFGLLEMTRQRLGPGLSKLLFTTCQHCRGTGRQRTPEARAQGILRRLGSALTQKGFTKVEVRTQPEVVDYLERSCRRDMDALAKTHGRELSLTGVEDQLEESVLRYLRTDGREVRPGGRRKKR